MSAVLAVDPGNEYSGAVVVDLEGRLLLVWPHILNTVLLLRCEVDLPVIADHLAIEMPRARGMPTANQEFETCVILGHFEYAFGIERTTRIFRSQVKHTICGRMQANDSNVSSAIRSLYPSTGGGVRPSVGTQKEKGPLYGVSRDAWQALGVALTYLHLHRGLDLHTIAENKAVVAGQSQKTLPGI